MSWPPAEIFPKFLLVYLLDCFLQLYRRREVAGHRVLLISHRLNFTEKWESQKMLAGTFLCINNIVYLPSLFFVSLVNCTFLPASEAPLVWKIGFASVSTYLMKLNGRPNPLRAFDRKMKLTLSSDVHFHCCCDIK